MKTKLLLSLSGGLDSTVLLAYLRHQEYDVRVISFRYGSKHNKYEYDAANKVADYYGLRLRTIDLSDVMSQFRSNLLLGQGEIPEGHYEDENMKLTVVPSRNIIFLSILSGYAWSIGAEQVCLAIHQGDHAIYPDCRKEFFKAMDVAVYLGTGGKVSFMAPFVDFNKADIVRIGSSLHVPFHLTRTCYKDQQFACGKCGSCNERLEAFAKNGMKDPIRYISKGE